MEVFDTDADDSFELDGEVAIFCLTTFSSFSALSTRLTRVLRTPVISRRAETTSSPCKVLLYCRFSSICLCYKLFFLKSFLLKLFFFESLLIRLFFKSVMFKLFSFKSLSDCSFSYCCLLSCSRDHCLSVSSFSDCCLWIRLSTTRSLDKLTVLNLPIKASNHSLQIWPLKASLVQ